MMVVEPPSSQSDALRTFSCRHALLALALLLAFFARVSTYHVAQAGAVFASTRDRFSDLSPSEHGSLHCPRHDSASRLCEITALDPQDVEKDALPDAPAIGLASIFRPLPGLASQPVRMASQAFPSPSLISAALPRGPPALRC